MPSFVPRDAVVLAAGNGARLSQDGDLPKPLVPVRGRALIDHVRAAVEAVGIRRLHVVVGHRGDNIRRHLAARPSPLETRCIENPDYGRANGLSLLATRSHVRSPFLLLMADHLFETRTLRRFLEQPVPPHGGLLAVDTKTDSVFDLDDATKVVTERGAVTSIGKRLSTYDAVDTGMFLLGESVFSAMQESIAGGDDSLTGGIAWMARDHLMQAWPIGDARWIDVDTPAALARAEALAAQMSLP